MQTGERRCHTINIFSVAVVLIRAVGIFLIATVLTNIPLLWSEIEHEVTTRQAFTDILTRPLIAGMLAVVILAAVLFLSARTLARFLTRGLESPDIQIDEGALSTLQAIAFSVVGIWVLAYSLPMLLMIVVSLALPKGDQSDGTGFVPTSFTYAIEVIAAHAARVAFGLWLVLGSRGIVRSLQAFWRKRISVDTPEEAAGTTRVGE
jgi:hypothetical protein